MEAASKEGKQEESPDTSTDQEMVPLSEAGVISEVTVDSIISYIKEATKLFRIAPYIIVSSYFREWQEYFILYAWWMNSNYMYLKIENWCRIFFTFNVFFLSFSRRSTVEVCQEKPCIQRNLLLLTPTLDCITLWNLGQYLKDFCPEREMNKLKLCSVSYIDFRYDFFDLRLLELWNYLYNIYIL